MSSWLFSRATKAGGALKSKAPDAGQRSSSTEYRTANRKRPRSQSRAWLLGRPAAVDGIVGAGDGRRGLPRQEHGQRGNLVHGHETPRRLAREDQGLGRVLGDALRLGEIGDLL